ncbi:MAG TPA: diaminopimelate decarboxylase, partial [Terriglobales bacterium]|nr:diaminopimelate decarboxylase [Terriglobales bacterium]
MTRTTMAARPPAFLYRRGRLHCESVPLEQLAAKHGTPLYVYSESTILQRLRAFDEAFGRVPHTVCYSVKANSNLSLLRLLAKRGAGFDVVSGGELQRVRRANRKAGARVVFSGVGKTPAEMDDALASGILLFNVESAAEMALLAARAAARRVRRPGWWRR